MSRKESPEPAAEQVVFLPLSELHPFPNHPFRVVDDEKMREMAASIQGCGVLLPGIARIRPEGGYEIVSGHRRKRACELAGRETMPFIVRNMTDDEAVIAMVDTNLQRENILPSERAFALKMKMEALKHQGKQDFVTSSQVGTKLRADEELAQLAGESRNQIQRYVRLNNLTPGLLSLVDEGKIALMPAVELSYLTKDEQTNLYDTIESEDCTPSLSQAQQMRKLSEQGKLNIDAVFGIMTKPKPNQQEKVTLPYPKLPMDKIRRYAKAEPTPQFVQDFLLKAVDHYCRYLDRQKDRGDR